MNSLGLVVLASTLLTSGQMGDGASNRRTITVSGEALIKVVPNEVLIGLGVESYDANLNEAVKKNEEASSRLLGAMKELIKEAGEIQTDVMSVDLDYKDHNPADFLIEGYVVRRIYTVTLKDTKLFEQTVQVAVQNGANRLLGFEFKTTELRQHRDEARKQAIIAAKEKASDMAKELNMRIGKPMNISEGWYNYWGGSHSWYGWGNYQSQSQNISLSMPTGGGGETAEETLPLGQIGVRAQVSVTFDLLE
ncbi:MAG: hypothetical protein HJJLKODD_02459 [Phycisphaerae bacterium]|nr:hypothetical protein [Phycisphaerae bacterium]